MPLDSGLDPAIKIYILSRGASARGQGLWGTAEDCEPRLYRSGSPRRGSSGRPVVHGPRGALSRASLEGSAAWHRRAEADRISSYSVEESLGDALGAAEPRRATSSSGSGAYVPWRRVSTARPAPASLASSSSALPPRPLHQSDESPPLAHAYRRLQNEPRKQRSCYPSYRCLFLRSSTPI